MGGPAVQIRRAGKGDLEAMRGLLEELFSIEPDFSPDPVRQRRGLKLLLGRENARLLVAEAEDRVVGMCSGQVVVSTAEGGPAVLAEDVVVTKAWRGRGVGESLLRGLYAWAAEQGAARLQLLADRDNGPALAFYRRLGWVETKLVCLRFMRG